MSTSSDVNITSDQQTDPSDNPTEIKPEPTLATTTTMDNQPEQQPEQSTQQTEQGPLSKLTDKAVNSKFMQKVNENVPSSAKTYIQKGAVPASKAIEAVDKTLQTDEAQRVATTAFDLLNAVSAFTLLVLTWTVTNLESTLNIDSAPPSTTSTDQTTREHGDDTKDEQEQEANGEEKTRKSELNKNFHEAILLFYRYKVVAYAAFSKASHYANKKYNQKNTTTNETEQDHHQQQQKEYIDPSSLDKVALDYAKKGFKLAKKVSAYSLNKASTFSGPGSTTIAPTADYIISQLPDDAKRVVKETTSPF